MLYLIHERSQALLAKLYFSTPMGGSTMFTCCTSPLCARAVWSSCWFCFFFFWSDVWVSVCTDPGRYKTAEVSHLQMKLWHCFNEMTAATMCCCQVRPRHVYLICNNPAAFLEPSADLQHLQPQTWDLWEVPQNPTETGSLVFNSYLLGS